MITEISQEYVTRFVNAAKGGHTQDVASLLSMYGSSIINAKNEYGWTALMWASEKSHYEVVSMLLGSGANTEVKNNDGWTALMEACYYGNYDVASLLLGEGANVNAQNNDENTALMWASQRGHLEVASLLLGSGANIEAKNLCGQTALMFSSLHCQLEVLSVLLEAGASTEAKDIEGKTALDYAQTPEVRTLIEIFRKEATPGPSLTEVSTGSQPFITSTTPYPPPLLSPSSTATNSNKQYEITLDSGRRVVANRPAMMMLNGMTTTSTKKLCDLSVNDVSNALVNSCPSIVSLGSPIICRGYSGQDFVDAVLSEEDIQSMDASMSKPDARLIFKRLQRWKEEGVPADTLSRPRLPPEAPSSAITVEIQPSMTSPAPATPVTTPVMTRSAPANGGIEVTTTTPPLSNPLVSSSPLESTPGSDRPTADHNQEDINRFVRAAEYGNALEISSMLSEFGRAIIDEKDEFGWTAFMWACCNRHHDVVSLLLREGVSIEHYLDFNSLPPVQSRKIEGVASLPDLLGDTSKRIASGSYGVVYQGVWERKHVAVKVLQHRDLTEKARKEFDREVQIMEKLRHPNIIPLLGYCYQPTSDGPFCCIMMEYMSRGSLYQTLQGEEDLPWDTRIRIAKDMSRGLMYLHMKDVIHRDMKSPNVVLDENFRACLCDFGLARVKNESRSLSTGSNSATGSLPWMAPELFQENTVYSKESDVYSFGITLWELASRKVPFENMISETIPYIIRQGTRDKIPDDCPSGFANIISICWDGEVSHRPDIKRVVQMLSEIRPIAVNKTR